MVESPEVLLARVESLFQACDYEEAFETAQQAHSLAQAMLLVATPEQREEQKLGQQLTSCAYALMVLANEVENYEVAEQAGRAVLTSDPDNAAAQDLTTTALVHNGKYREALVFLHAMLTGDKEISFDQPMETSVVMAEINRRDALFSRLGKCYLGLAKGGETGLYLDATRYFVKARDVFKYSSDAREGLNELLEILPHLPPEEFTRIVEELGADEINAEFLRMLRGNILYERGHVLFNGDEHEEAHEIFEEMIRAEPESLRAWRMKAACLVQLDRDDEAEQAYQMVLKMDPEYTEAIRYTAGRKIDRGDVEEAVEMLKPVLEKRPDYAPGYSMLGRAFEAAARQGADTIDMAFEAYQRAYNLEPDEPYHTYFLGKLRALTGDCNAALELAGQLMQADPDLGGRLLEVIREVFPEVGGENAAGSEDIVAINLLSDRFEQNVKNEDRPENLGVIVLLSDDVLIVEGTKILALYERELEAFPGDGAVTAGLHQHLSRLATLYIDSVHPRLLQANTPHTGTVSSASAADAAVEYLRRAYEIQPTPWLCYSFSQLFSYANFYASAHHWLGAAETLAKQLGHIDAANSLRAQRLNDEAEGKTSDPQFGSVRWPRSTTFGVLPQAAPAPAKVVDNAKEAPKGVGGFWRNITGSGR